MKTEIKHNKASAIFFNNKFIDTNTVVDLSFSDALRISRQFEVQFHSPEQKVYNPQYWKEKIFGFVGDADMKSGFGNCTVNLLKYSLEKGYDVRWIGRGLDVPFLEYLNKKLIPEGIGAIWHEQPKDLWRNSPFAKNIAFLPFETTRIPNSWVDKINRMDAVFVPCAQNVEMMIDSGVKIPIEVIHWGVDENLFYPIDRNNKVFTFGIYGALSYRKGMDVLIQAFEKAFPINEYKDNVKLVCQTSQSVYSFDKRDDKRIEVRISSIDQKDILKQTLKDIDCYVFPTRGEGAGLPTIEALASGIPVIATGWSGPRDYMNEECGWFIDYKMVPADSFTNDVYKEYCGNWAEPDVDDLAEKMKYAFEHQDEVKQKGRYGAKWVRENFLWSNTIEDILKKVNKYF